jgi:glycosyltransferase involved in cell wall biosynthesis
LQNVDVVVHSHLRWDGVWQRPQQIISRLARDSRVVFIEEPLFEERHRERPELRVRQEDSGVTILQPLLPPQNEPLPQVAPENQRLNRKLVAEWLRNAGYRDVLRWHYAPMALYLAETCSERGVVYDCMDELSAFKGAPPELVERERELMAQAAVVFTGGRSIYEAKRALHPRTYRFDSGVEVEHFQQAAQPETTIPEDVASLPRPILGYYGVIDERMDYEALEYLARRHPEWSFLMVGPVTKVSEEDLPKGANIHYTGQRTYRDLPRYLKAFDVALVLFADNAATRYLSPTKTLEYFAGLKPVVSAPIADIVENYADVVRLARSPQEYDHAIKAALTEENTERLRQGLARAGAHTWDAIVEQMREILAAALPAR